MPNLRFSTVVFALTFPLILCQCNEEETGSGKGKESDPTPTAPADPDATAPEKDVNLLSKVRAKRVEIENLNTLKQYFNAAQMVSLESGLFPDSLEELKAEGSIPEDFKLKDPKTGKGGLDPIYFKGLTSVSNASFILFACPAQNFNGNRSVARVGGMVENIPEEEYQKQIKAQAGES